MGEALVWKEHTTDRVLERRAAARRLPESRVQLVVSGREPAGRGGQRLDHLPSRVDVHEDTRALGALGTDGEAPHEELRKRTEMVVN